MNSINILLVEDNEGDILLTTEALTESGISHTINVVKDCCEAMRFLEKKEEYTDFTPPDLILLDINLPKLSGHEVLENIKKSEEFKHLPVIILSTSNSSEDILKAKQLDADFFLTKPSGNENYSEMIDSIKDFWVSREQNTKVS